MNLTLAEKFVLVGLVAATDSIWTPCRDVGHPHAVNVFETRTEFRRDGLRWSSPAATIAGRRKSHQAMESLIAAGSVLAKKSDSGHRTAFVHLSATAYDLARRLAGLPGFTAGRTVLDAVASLTRRPATVLKDVWIPEIALNSGKGWGDGHCDELVAIQDAAIPALVSGWLTSRSDSRQHVYYALTSAGQRLLDCGKSDIVRLDSEPVLTSAGQRLLDCGKSDIVRLDSEPVLTSAGQRLLDCGDIPIETAEPIEADARLQEFYHSRLATELEKRGTREPESPAEIGLIPLPVSQTNVHLSCWSPDNAI